MKEIRKLSKQYDKSLQKYLSTHMCAWDTFIPELYKQFKTLAVKIRIQNGYLSDDFLNYSSIFSKNKGKPIKQVQLLIWFHKLTIQGYELQFKMPDNEKTFSLSLTKSMDFSFFLKSMFLPKYMKYIKKRNIYNQNMRIEKQTQNLPFSDIFQIYNILNLLNNGLAFTKELKHLIRYYQQKYGFVYDLNMILALDFKLLYECIVEIVQKNVQRLQKQTTEQYQNCRFLKQMSQILNQIEKVHENLYFIYCNHYHDISIKKYLPRFIDCQKIQNEIEAIQKKMSAKIIDKCILNELSLNSSFSISDQDTIQKESLNLSTKSSFYDKLRKSKQITIQEARNFMDIQLSYSIIQQHSDAKQQPKLQKLDH